MLDWAGCLFGLIEGNSVIWTSNWDYLLSKTAMKKHLEQRINRAISLAEGAPEGSADLPHIIAFLERMKAATGTAPKEREKLAMGLGKLVLDNYTFSEGSVGTILLEIAGDFASKNR
jgi:hypothetical protein